MKILLLCVSGLLCSVLIDTFPHISESYTMYLALVFQTQFISQIIAFYFPES